MAPVPHRCREPVGGLTPRPFCVLRVPPPFVCITRDFGSSRKDTVPERLAAPAIAPATTDAAFRPVDEIRVNSGGFWGGVDISAGVVPVLGLRGVAGDANLAADILCSLPGNGVSCVSLIPYGKGVAFTEGSRFQRVLGSYPGGDVCDVKSRHGKSERTRASPVSCVNHKTNKAPQISSPKAPHHLVIGQRVNAETHQ
jgi:hypothetical protein